MRLMMRLFVAFCVATILAQGIVLVMSAARGNLKSDTFVKGIALLNGIDISGERLQKVLDNYKQVPVPEYEDVVNERAQMSRDLELREELIKRMEKNVTEKLDQLKTTKAALDRRVDEFYAVIDKKNAEVLTEGMQEAKRILEAIAPDQAKIQLLKLYEKDQKDEVLAIFKAMPTDKAKKILGEFAGEAENEQFNEIVLRMLAGEPMASLLDEARQISPTSQP